jgi:hypothetical protein
MDPLTSQESATIAAQIDALIRSAREQTGLTDLGDTWFLEPLGDLLGFAARESGGLIPGSQPENILIGYLADRLKLIEHLKHHPEVRDEQLDVACVIISPARSGSTMLQGMLGASPQLTSTYYWELMTPFPFPGEKPGDPSPRIAAGKKRLQAWFDSIEQSEAWHHLAATSYEEEIFFFDRSFISCMYTNYFYVPGYARWIQTRDQTKSYQELKLWLQYLQSQMPERRQRKWLLKAPHYFLTNSVETIMRTFPAAKMLWIHRRAEDMIPSVASISSTSLIGYGYKFELSEFGQQYVDIYRDALDKLLPLHKRTPPERFIDLQYKDLIADPVGTFRYVFKRLGLTVRDQDEECVAKWLAMNKRDRTHKHQYTAEQFGLTRESIARQFADYHKAFNVRAG